MMRFNGDENRLNKASNLSLLFIFIKNILRQHMHFLTTIGIILAVTGIVLILVLKSPLKTSDKLLIAILVTFVVKFSFDEASLITGNRLFSSVAAVSRVSRIWPLSMPLQNRGTVRQHRPS